MTLVMQEAKSFPKLITDSESLTYSDSCVKSDIADIITKIYSPRPLMYTSNVCKSNDNSCEESRDVIGDCIQIYTKREKEEKRFGFYFEPVSRNFAKTIVDSSTTSGSVSMPIVRYKAKRLRHVCECCKRKMPFREHETRVKRGCMICRRNHGSDGNSSTAAVVRKDIRSVHSCQMKASNRGVVASHPVATLKVPEQPSEPPAKLRKKWSTKNLITKQSADALKKGDTQLKINCCSAMSDAVPDARTERESNKKQECLTYRANEGPVKNVSFMQRVMSNLFGYKTNVTVKENEQQDSRECGNVKKARKNISKVGINVKEEANCQGNNELSVSVNREQVNPSGLPMNIKNGRVSRSVSNKKIELPEENNGNCKTLSNKESKNIRNLLGQSCPDLANTRSRSKPEINHRVGDEKCRDSMMDDKDVEIGLNDLEDKTEKTSVNNDEKYQVAYKGLKIDRRNDWAYEFWGRIFGTCHSIVSFFTAFFLHLLTFVLQSLIQPLFFGTVRITADHLFKPCLLAAFESVIQPVCYLLERSMTSVRDVCIPVAECFGAYCAEVSLVCRACRVVEINKNYNFNEEI